MKKKKNIILICIIFFIATLGFFIYDQYISKSLRYSSPSESFEHSSPRGTKLVEILECDNTALLIYEQNGTFSAKVIAEDNRGWTPMSLEYRNKRKVTLDSGFIYVKEVENKIAVQVITIVEGNKGIPAISDNINSSFLLRSYNLDSGRCLVYGFLVSNDVLPKDYKIMIDNLEISVYG